MKLAVLTHGFPTDKNPISANFLEPFLEKIAKQGHSIWVITPRMKGQKPLGQSYPVITFDWGGGEKLLGQLKLWNPIDSFSLLRFLHSQKRILEKLHSRIKFDHVLVVWMIPNALAARSVKEKEGLNYSSWSLGTDINRFASNPTGRLIIKNVARGAEYLFANSRRLCSKITGLSGKRAHLLSTYRPLDEPDSKLIPRLDRKKFHFLCVARLEPVKGPDILIEAFIELSKTLPKEKKLQLHLLGEGSMRRGLEKKVRGYGIEDQVMFYGMVKPIEVAGFLKVVDCLVIPSRNESMPVSFWEAQAAGVPVIGTDVGDLGLVIREFGQGLVVKPEDVGGLAAAIQEAVIKGNAILKPNPKAIRPDPKRTARKFLEIIEGEG